MIRIICLGSQEISTQTTTSRCGTNPLWKCWWVTCCLLLSCYGLFSERTFFYSTELHLREYHHLTWYRIVKEWTHEETRLFPSVLLSLRSSFHLVSISSERTFDMGIPWNLFTWVILIQDVSAAHDTQIFTVIPEVSLLLKCTHYWTCSSTI